MLNAVGRVDNLGVYLDYIGKIAVPSKEDEIEWSNAYHQRCDKKAAQKLVLSHLKFVVYIAKRYSKVGIPLSDLIQEGNIGLMKAVERFSPSYGVRFVTFSVRWIKGQIHSYIMNNIRIMKSVSTHAQRKLFYNLHKFKKTGNWLSKSETQMIANELKVKVVDVIEMEKRLSGHDVPILPFDDGDDSTKPNEFRVIDLEAQGADPAEVFDEDEKHVEQYAILKQSLAKLDKRSRDIVTQRYLMQEKPTLRDLSHVYNISMERVRQLEVKAISTMRNYINT